LKFSEEIEVFEETEVIGESTQSAFEHASEWLQDREDHRIQN